MADVAERGVAGHAVIDVERKMEAFAEVGVASEPEVLGDLVRHPSWVAGDVECDLLRLVFQSTACSRGPGPIAGGGEAVSSDSLDQRPHVLVIGSSCPQVKIRAVCRDG